MNFKNRILPVVLAVGSMFSSVAANAAPLAEPSPATSVTLSPEVQSYCDLQIRDWLAMPPAKQIMVFDAVANAFADKVKTVNPTFSDAVRSWFLNGKGRDNFDADIKDIDQTKTMYGAVVALAHGFKDTFDQRAQNTAARSSTPAVASLQH